MPNTDLKDMYMFLTCAWKWYRRHYEKTKIRSADWDALSEEINAIYNAHPNIDAKTRFDIINALTRDIEMQWTARSVFI